MSLLQNFSQFNNQNKVAGEWSRVRNNARKFFDKHGLPTRKDEDWKYTSVKTLSEQQYSVKTEKVALNQAQKETLKKYLNPEFTNIVFINGVLSEEYSELKQLSKSLDWSALSDVLKGKSFKNLISTFKAERENVGNIRQDVFEALSSAYAWQGLVIEVKKEVAISKPVHLVYMSVGNKVASYPKNFVIVGERSKFSLIETYIGDGEAQFLSQSTEVILKSSSKLEYLRVQETSLTNSNVGVTRFFQHESSNLESLAYATGGQLSRHNLEVYICGSNSFSRVQGLTMASGKQHFDSHTLIDHVVGGSQASQFYKSILNDQSKSVFDGKVLIRQNAQKAYSEQLAKSLLLSSEAEADSKPNLEIYADDVKATHGSTVGQLNEEEIFYLLSRAISRDQAIEMLSLGFVTDVVYQVTDTNIQQWLLGLLKSAYKRLQK